MTRATSLELLRNSIGRLESSELQITGFVTLWRNQQELWEALPERFMLVLDEILARLESTALFSEESCSFSRGDLLKNLRLWFDMAEARLDQ